MQVGWVRRRPALLGCGMHLVGTVLDALSTWGAHASCAAGVWDASCGDSVTGRQAELWPIQARCAGRGLGAWKEALALEGLDECFGTVSRMLRAPSARGAGRGLQGQSQCITYE